MRVGIIGAGPAGSLAATLLAQSGHEVILFEHKLGREKACGGGFTARALDAGALLESHVPCTSITELELLQDSQSAVLPLNAPFHVYARAESDVYLMNQATAAGALLQVRHVTNLFRSGSGWEVIADDETFHLDWLIGADGTHSRVRATCWRPFELADLSMTFGYYLPGKFHPQRAIVEFLPRGFPGYLWSFPRTGHSSVGIISTANHPPTKILRQYVDRFLRRYYGLPPPGRDQIYGAMVPTLRESTLRSNCCAGENWALIGDAAGFVDSITGEGIYFALRSARLLGLFAHEKSLKEFDRLWRQDFGEELVRSARLKQRFYYGGRWQRSYAEMLPSLTQQSRTVRKIENEFVAGKQGYVGLKWRIVRESPRILAELLFGR
ncbi:MAG: NAD(P)/FAD-dependent oxidoreductase [Acidobacteria bacterium]|nr:NAD(P)/FAD-dependent oxidoreductase [Acidobacteriota bacterium]